MAEAIRVPVPPPAGVAGWSPGVSARWVPGPPPAAVSVRRLVYDPRLQPPHPRRP
ncbi:MAG: hypothetical protein OWV35_10990 [Firmicutes bacterium]|nr:hypothetical protein [Bacillota bacterium]